ncbi:MAG: cysteine desulfurase [Betaproteobacteria bacterium]|nr:MAG: cysteine desulfurase [Betaproteobacteria bacterium]
MSAYFDHNATTRLDDAVLEAMMPFLRDEYGNASSRHDAGIRARKALNVAREQVAALVNVQPSQVVFVSGGTEANNMFVKGMASYLKPSQIAVSAIEHPCVMKPAATLARSGWKLRKINVDATGVIDMADVEAAFGEPTALVSVMLANNETGVVQPVGEVAQRARAAKAWIHTDAVQVAGKLPVDFEALGVHAMTLSAHKMYGPKGAGALVVDKRLPIKPLVGGGGHEHGLRSGTENVPAIVGFGAACELAAGRRQALAEHTAQLRDLIETGLVEIGATVFGAGAPRIPNTTYFAFQNIDGETLVIELNKAGFAVASGSACSSTSTDPSATLLAMGVDPDLARGAVRISLGVDNTMQQAQEFLIAIATVVDRLRRLTAVAV